MAKAKFDVKTEATRAFYAGVGVNDLAVEVVRDLVTTAQKSVQQIDLDPKSLREQAVTVAKARRKAIEARVAELQSDAKSVPAKVQARVTELVNENTAAYGDLVTRGQSLVGRIRKQESTVAATSSASTTVAKAKTTRTQATKTTKARTKVTPATKKKATATKSSAKATATAAKKTASNTAAAVADAAQKVGD